MLILTVFLIFKMYLLSQHFQFSFDMICPGGCAFSDKRESGKTKFFNVILVLVFHEWKGYDEKGQVQYKVQLKSRTQM